MEHHIYSNSLWHIKNSMQSGILKSFQNKHSFVKILSNLAKLHPRQEMPVSLYKNIYL